MDFTYYPSGKLAWNENAGERYVYDGPNLIAEYDSSGNILRRYVHELGDDHPLVWYEGSGTTNKRWLSSDEKGSVTAITDSSGNIININSYDEWGIPQSTNIGRFQYTGQQWVPELGMYYYKARIYSPTLGRFLQTDSIGYSDGPNWYAYVHNDPVNGKDPTGNIGTAPTGSHIAIGDGGGICDTCSGHTIVIGTMKTTDFTTISSYGSATAGTFGISVSMDTVTTITDNEGNSVSFDSGDELGFGEPWRRVRCSYGRRSC